MSSAGINSAKLPLPVPPTIRRFRTPRKNIPQTKAERDAVLAYVRGYIERVNPVPPLPFEELRVHAERIIAEMGLDPIYRDYTGVIFSNEVWRETLATIPYERRLLLMPKCLRVESKCPAPFDEFGLLCKQCGLCTIQDFQNEAERLGYAVLVAEGSAIVMSLIQTGKIEAIVGISCLPVLERTFPYVEAAAIPAVAVPLLQDDCIDTTVDIDWVWDYIHLTSEDRTRRLNLNALHEEVRGWFDLENINRLMGPANGHAEELGRMWLARAGKRWRPFLTVACSQALRSDAEAPLTDELRKLALAVECFHKASLIHDDIEDDDSERYGEPTLHAEQGVAVALNVGDLLIGEGYRLIAEANVPAHAKAEMLRIAAEGQRCLCRGQGMELEWLQHRRPLSPGQVLEIFKQKTAPAFSVALLMGAALAGRLDETEEVLMAYSEALGIAYQIRDDLDDRAADTTAQCAAVRPNIIEATARERFRGDLAEAAEHCLMLMERYKEQAVRSLQEVENPNLKGLLRRVVGRIFNELEIKGWCREFEVKNQPAEPEAAVLSTPVPDSASDTVLAGAV
ncbi:MAG: polyprenyl synthetase family protein [Verrucomicrobiales bacterium]|nr:polyprenyl synthetase family protein [Verrucomicrobiales bacterium]